MRPPAPTPPHPHQRWTAAAAVAAALGAWDVALFLFLGGAAPSRALLARAALLDAMLALPVAALALWLCQPLSRRLASAGCPSDGVVATALPALLFGVLLVPAAALREGAAALGSGAATGLAGAADALTFPIDAGRWLCTAAARPTLPSSTAARSALAASAGAALLLQIPALPAFFAVALARRRAAFGHAIMSAAALAATAALVLSTEPRAGHGVSERTLGPSCRPGLPVRIYSVAAVEADLATGPPRARGGPSRARLFALDGDLPGMRSADASALPDGDSPGPSRHLAQPLVLRAALGECLHVVFTNRLRSLPAMFRVHGLPYLATRVDAGAVPPDYEALPGETITYSFQIPSDPERARAYLVRGGRGEAGPGDPLAVLAIDQPARGAGAARGQRIAR